MAIKKLDLGKNLKKSTKLKRIAEKIKSDEYSFLASETAKLEEERVIEQFKKDFDKWVIVNTIKDPNGCKIIKVKAVKNPAMYDEVNNYKLVSGPVKDGFEVGYGPAKEAGVPRWSIYRYVFAVTHKVWLDSSSIHIHHIDGNHFNNNPENLIALPNHIHNLLEFSNNKKLKSIINNLI